MHESLGMIRGFVGKSDENNPQRRPEYRLESNIKIDFREKGLDGMAQDREQWMVLVNKKMNLWVP
jgi:hypothetical protein